MYGVNQTLDSEERSAALQGGASMKSLIQRSMQDDFVKD